MHLIHDHKTNRFTILFGLYMAVGGYYDYTKDLKILAEHNGMSAKDFRAVYRYLVEEGLIELRNGETEYCASLSHKGLKAVEDVFMDTNSPTYYFPAYRDMRG